MGVSSSKHTVTLYHYTNKEGKDAILESRFIKMSTDRRLDAILGEGVYMTPMNPFDHTREQIVHNNWQGLSFDTVKHKTDYVFKVKVVKGPNLKFHKEGDRNIYMFGLENLKLELLKEWTLYDCTSATPKKIKSGIFSIGSPESSSDENSVDNISIVGTSRDRNSVENISIVGTSRDKK